MFALQRNNKDKEKSEKSEKSEMTKIDDLYCYGCGRDFPKEMLGRDEYGDFCPYCAAVNTIVQVHVSPHIQARKKRERVAQVVSVVGFLLAAALVALAILR